MTWYQLTLMWFGAYILAGIVIALFMVRKDLAKGLSQDEFNEICSKLLLIIFLWVILCPLLFVFDVSNKFKSRFESKVNRMTSGQKDLVSFLAELGALSDDVSHIRQISKIAEQKKERRRKKWYSV